MLNRCIKPGNRRLLWSALTIVAVIGCGSQPASAQNASQMCASEPLLALETGASFIPSSCTVPAGGILLESLYYQNASHVGGTALAAYPLLQVTAGVARRVEFIADLPSQVAESGLRGAGLYPRSHSGYGFRYRFAETGRIAFAAGLAVVPPASLYAPTETQPKYALDVASMYQLTSAVTIKEFTQASTSHSVGFGRVLPEEALGADIAQSRLKVFSTDVGTRIVTARARAQSFADISVKRLLDRKLAFNVGLGTTFNPVANTKAHYLSAGFTLRP